MGEGKDADVTLLKVKKNEMEERHNVILERNTVKFKYTSPLNVAGWKHCDR